MVKKHLFIFLSSFVFLASCSPIIPHPSDTDSNDENTTSGETSSTSNETTSSSSNTTGSDTNTITNTNTTTNEAGVKNIKIIGFNDFHGYTNNSGKYLGLSKFSTFMKEERNNQTTFLLSAGDTRQGQIESNYNYGKYVTEAFNIIGLDAMAIGNHEFDWDIKYPLENKELANYPFLLANVVKKGTHDYIPFVDGGSALIERDGFKLGVIGTADPTIKNSILYTRIKDYDFMPRYEYVKAESDKLLASGADFIVLADHGNWEQSEFTNDAEKAKILENCSVNAVLAGHSHTLNNWKYNNSIPILQAYSELQNYDEINLSFDTNTKDVSIISSDVKSFNSSLLTDDDAISSLYKEKYDVDSIKNEIVGKSTGTFVYNNQLSNFASELGYQFVKKYTDKDIVGYVHNQARKSLYSGNITIGTLFSCFPFENESLVFKAKGSVIKSMFSYKHNKDYNASSLSNDKEYYCAGIDYTVLKSIDYISEIETIKPGTYIRDIVKDYLKINTTISPNDFNR